MKRTALVVSMALVLGVAVGAIGNRALNAQQAPSVKRSILLKQHMSVPGREAVMALAEFPPGAAEGRHTHPADLYGFVLEGTISLEHEGKPTVTLNAGDVFSVAPGMIHQAFNNGDVTAKAVAVFVAEQGKPLTTQVQ